VVVEGDRPNEVATQSAPKNFDKVTYTIQVRERGLLVVASSQGLFGTNLLLFLSRTWPI
jgi:hypothetical protein